MKFIKKRLPALLLALVVAVLPLGMAVPVTADVLEGVQPVEYGYGLSNGFYFTYPFSTIPDLPGILDFDAPFIAFYSVSQNTAYFIVLIYSDEIYFNDNVELVVSSGVTFAYVELLNFDGAVFNPITSSNWLFKNSGDGMTFSVYNQRIFTFNVELAKPAPLFSITPLNIVEIPSSLPARGGILSVFSGVGSWLAGAVGNMITMFWTPEGGLSVLGILAVCSLGFAVLLLFVYLIAGWLKFR